MKVSKKKYGFALMELLVVLGIIGILFSVVLFNVNEAHKQARDTGRKADLKQLQLALDLYFQENGEYPAGCDNNTTHFVGPGPFTSSDELLTCDDDNYIPDLTSSNMLTSLPIDPIFEHDDNKGYLYKTNLDQDAYKVIIYDSVESEDVTASSEFTSCPVSCSDSTDCGVNNRGDNIVDTYGIYGGGSGESVCW